MIVAANGDTRSISDTQNTSKTEKNYICSSFLFYVCKRISKFNEINSNFPIIIQNLEVIVNELKSCQSNYKINDEFVAGLLRGQELK